MKNKICLSKSSFIGIILMVLAIYTVLNDIKGFVSGFMDALSIN